MLNKELSKFFKLDTFLEGVTNRMEDVEEALKTNKITTQKRIELVSDYLRLYRIREVYTNLIASNTSHQVEG